MFNRACSATVRVSWRRRGDTISAPIPDTFSCERVRTDSVGVTPHGAHVRRSTGSIRNPVSSRQIRWPPRRASFFYPGPVLLDPLAHAAIVALFGAWLGPLRTEATRPEQPADVIRMVGDLEVVADEVDDPPAGPQACPVAGRFGSRHDQARQLTLLRCRQLRRSARRRPRTKTGAALPPMRPFPSAHGTPIHAQTFGHDMNGDLTLQQIDRAQPSPLELRRAPLWAHAHLPQRIIGHYLCRSHYFAAKYSLPHAAAALVLRGNAGYHAFTDEAVRDPAIAAFRRRVTVREDPALSA